MQYNQSATGQGICQHTDYLSGTDLSSYPQVDKDRSANIWQKLFTTEILDSMDDWDFAGEISTHDLSANQQEYPFPTRLRKIKRIEIDYDGDGNFVPMKRMDVNQFQEQAMATSAQINASFDASNPKFGLFDESLFTYPVADTDRTAAIKIWHSEAIADLTATTGGNTAVPAFAEEFHVGVSYGQTLDYARKTNNEDLIRDMERALYGSTLTRKGKVGGLITRLRDFYSTRANDKLDTLRSKYYQENYK